MLYGRKKPPIEEVTAIFSANLSCIAESGQARSNKGRNMLHSIV